MGSVRWPWVSRADMEERIAGCDADAASTIAALRVQLGEMRGERISMARHCDILIAEARRQRAADIADAIAVPRARLAHLERAETLTRTLIESPVIQALGRLMEAHGGSRA